jgi:hypothetical protein
MRLVAYVRASKDEERSENQFIKPKTPLLT